MEAKQEQGSRWQYKRLEVPQTGQVPPQQRFDNELHDLGNEGWEIAGVTETMVYLKKPLKG